MNVPLNDVVYLDFATCSPVTAAATNADSTPTFAVYENSTASDIGVGGNATNITTGLYNFSFTCSAANGFELDKWYNVVASATVGAIAGKKVVKTFRIVAAEAVAGYPVADVTKWIGGTIPAVNVTGVPIVDLKYTLGTLSPAAAGYISVDWAQVANATTAINLSGTNIKTTQKVDVDTIKTNPVVNAGTVTFPTTATLASTTNITAGTITTTTNLTNAATSGDLTAAMIASVTGAVPTAAANATALLDASNGVETGYTLRQALKLMLASMAGKLSGAATTSVSIRDITDSKTRISATVDSDGNRTAFTYDLT